MADKVMSSMKSLTIGSNANVVSVLNQFVPGAAKIAGLVSEGKNIVESVKSGHVMAADNVVWKATSIISDAKLPVVTTRANKTLRQTENTSAKSENLQSAGQSQGSGLKKEQFPSANGYESDKTTNLTVPTPANTEDISQTRGTFDTQKFPSKKGTAQGLVLGASLQFTQANENIPAQATGAPASTPITSMKAETYQFPNVRNSSGSKKSVLGFTDTDVLVPSFKKTYPSSPAGVLTTETNPFIINSDALKPPFKNDTTEFPFLRGEKASGINGTNLEPAAVSDIDSDTAAAQPSSAVGSQYVDTAKSRIGTPDRGNTDAKSMFAIAPRSGETAVRSENADMPRMSAIKRNIVQGVDGYFIEEFIQSHRFYVADASGDDRSVFEWEDNGTPPTTLSAGFSFCTAPKMEMVNKEIKEGTWEFPRVFITGANAQTMTLSKGFIRSQSGFYLWLLNAMRGQLTRRTIKVVTYGRNPKKSRAWTQGNNLASVAACVWTLYNCYPLGYRSGQDWDADSGKIQISELDMHYEWFEESEGLLYRNTTQQVYGSVR